MIRSIIDIFEELEATAGSNAKKDILNTHKENKLLKRVFIAAQDPYVVYYVNKFKVPHAVADSDSEDITVKTFLDIISEKLSTREVTGNAAKALPMIMVNSAMLRQ